MNTKDLNPLNLLTKEQIDATEQTHMDALALITKFDRSIDFDNLGQFQPLQLQNQLRRIKQLWGVLKGMGSLMEDYTNGVSYIPWGMAKVSFARMEERMEIFLDMMSGTPKDEALSKDREWLYCK